MISRLQIQNFRAIGDMQFERIAQFNLLTGRNGAGKTTVLEALFLNCGGANPRLVISLNAFRGQNFQHPLVDTLFRTLFRGQDPNLAIRIDATEQRLLKSYPRELRLEAIVSDKVVPGRSASSKFVTGLRASFSGRKEKNAHAKFAWKFDAAVSKLSLPNQFITQDDLFDIEQPQQEDFVFARFVSLFTENAKRDAISQLSDVTRRRGLGSVINIIKILDPRVLNLVPLVEQGAQTIYVDVGDAELQPWHILGSGFLHLLNLALALEEIEEGVVLIDELESGIHYSILPRVALALLEVMRLKPKLQVFATTHSSEMICALSNAASQIGFTDLCAYNVSSRTGRVTQFEAEDLNSAVNADLEIR